MRNGQLGRRHVMGGLATAGMAAGMGAPARAAAAPVQLISHRYPALEFWAAKMKNSVPGVQLNAQLVPFDKALELSTIALSSKADTVDLVYASDATVTSFAKNGWIRPIDDLWAKYKEQYKLGDIADAVMKVASYDGHIYMIPANINLMLFFYRKDLFDKAGKQPPQTLVEYQQMAKFFNSPMRAGTISCLRPVDATMNEADWYMHIIGPGWFDETWHPIFNTDPGVRAIEALKETTRYAQQGFTSAANDECSITLQQDAAVMGLQWATRAGAMDDPKQSHVVGKMEWTQPPQGHGRFSADGYTLSAFSKQDPDLLFRIVAGAVTEENMREAASLTVPTRLTILNDPAMQQKNRYYPAAAQAIKTAMPYPALPEFYQVGEFIARRIVQAVSGEMPVKPALDAAAGETTAFLRQRGYKL